MTIYLLDAATNDTTLGKLVFAENAKLGDDLCQFRGKSQTNWKPVRFKWFLHEGQKRSDLIIKDFVLVFGAGMDIVLNEKSKTVLSAALGADTEYLPIEVQGEKPNSWYLLNITHIIDNALSKEKSTFRFLRNGAISGVEKAVFVESNIPNDRVFVYPEAIRHPMVKGEFLARLVMANQLTGLKFHPYKTIEDNALPKSVAG